MNRVAFLFCSCFPDFFFLPCSNQVTWRPKDLGPHSFPEASGLIRVDAERAEQAPSPHGSQWDSPRTGYFSAHLCSLFHRQTHSGQQRRLQSPDRKERQGYTFRFEDRTNGRPGQIACPPSSPALPSLAFALERQGAVPSIPLPSSSSGPPPRPPRALWHPPAHPSL